MPEVDGATLIARSLKQHGVEYMFGIVGVPGRADRLRRSARGHPVLRHAARAVGLLRGAGRRLPHRTAGRLPRRLRARHDQRHLRPRQRVVEPLADDPARRRVRHLAARHGRVPGGAAGRGRAPLVQVRGRGRSHRHASPTSSSRRSARRSTAAPAPVYLDLPGDIISGKVDDDGVHAQRRRVPEPPRSLADPAAVEAAHRRAEDRRAPARHRRQGRGVRARRGRGARVHRGARSCRSSRRRWARA